MGWMATHLSKAASYAQEHIDPVVLLEVEPQGIVIRAKNTRGEIRHLVAWEEIRTCEFDATKQAIDETASRLLAARAD